MNREDLITEIKRRFYAKGSSECLDSPWIGNVTANQVLQNIPIGNLQRLLDMSNDMCDYDEMLQLLHHVIVFDPVIIRVKDRLTLLTDSLDCICITSGMEVVLSRNDLDMERTTTVLDRLLSYSITNVARKYITSSVAIAITLWASVYQHVVGDVKFYNIYDQTARIVMDYVNGIYEEYGWKPLLDTDVLYDTISLSARPICNFDKSSKYLVTDLRWNEALAIYRQGVESFSAQTNSGYCFISLYKVLRPEWKHAVTVGTYSTCRNALISFCFSAVGIHNDVKNNNFYLVHGIPIIPITMRLTKATELPFD